MGKNNKKILNPCTIYILLWLIGVVQGFFLSNSLVARLFYIPFLIMTLYYYIKVLLSFPPSKTMKVLCVLFAVLVCYGFALLVLNNVNGEKKESFLMMLFRSLGPIFSFYVFSKQGLLTEKRMLLWFLPFLIVTVTSFFVTQQQSLINLSSSGTEYEDITNNTSYLFVGLFPFVFLLRRKIIWQYLVVAILLYFIVLGLKRGAMLTGSFLLFWFVYRSINTISKGRKIVIILLTIITIIIGYQFVINFYENSDYFQYRVEVTMEGKTSQRDYIYTTLWQHYRSNHNLFQVMFGEGAYSTQNIVGMKAHNDWLELLIDCGLLTILLYLFYWVCFVIDCRKSKSNALIYSMLGGCFIFTFVRTFFSMSFSDIPFYISMIMGYSFAYPIRTKHIYPNNSSAEILNSSCYCSTK